MNPASLPRLLMALALPVLPLNAQGKLPRTAETFEIDGNKAFLYAAPKPARGKPWLWYAAILSGLEALRRAVHVGEVMKAGREIRVRLPRRSIQP